MLRRNQRFILPCTDVCWYILLRTDSCWSILICTDSYWMLIKRYYLFIFFIIWEYTSIESIDLFCLVQTIVDLFCVCLFCLVQTAAVDPILFCTDTWLFCHVQTAVGKGRKKSNLVLPVDKIHSILSKDLQQNKLEVFS